MPRILAIRDLIHRSLIEWKKEDHETLCSKKILIPQKLFFGPQSFQNKASKCTVNCVGLHSLLLSRGDEHEVMNGKLDVT